MKRIASTTQQFQNRGIRQSVRNQKTHNAMFHILVGTRLQEQTRAVRVTFGSSQKQRSVAVLNQHEMHIHVKAKTNSDVCAYLQQSPIEVHSQALPIRTFERNTYAVGCIRVNVGLH